KVVIEPWINLFTVEFISLQLPSSKAVEYSVKLEGFDKDWRNIGSNTEATYTNLPPGDYKFKVQSNDIRGSWSNNTTMFEIEVLTPIWKSWGAILVYFSIFLLILIAAQRYSVNWNEMKNNLKLEKLNREKDEEIHRMQLAFFTNISHDLRTPLTLIIGNLKRLMSVGEMSAKSRMGYNVIENNVNRLLRLANELLDFRKIETGNLKLNVVNGNLVLFVKEMYYSFYDHAGERNIKYNLICKEEELNIFFDYDQMEKVMFNLLSNAFKYTPNQGEVSIIVDNTGNKHVGVEVKNTGHILSELQQQKIFDRFYQTSSGVEDNDIGPGNGIGLSIVNDIVNLHNGTIEVSSNN
ncbi:MAG: ATP-binding protein, partial [Bacteroidales bacterium]|nr:ATP-binding protein [Bacteroidales bacterium]